MNKFYIYFSFLEITTLSFATSRYPVVSYSTSWFKFQMLIPFHKISMLLFSTWDNEPLLFWPNFFLLLIVHLLLILTHMCSIFYGEKFELTCGLLVCIYMWHSMEMSQVSHVVTACKVEILNWKIFSPNISSSALTYSHFDVAQHDILNYIILYLILNQGSVQQNYLKIASDQKQ